MPAMNEFDLIARLTRTLPSNSTVVVGPGDDCAVLDLGLSDRWVLFKADAVVEGIHFAAGTAPEKVGHKALGRCLSDVAAMGGWPSSAVITLGLPRQWEPEYVERVYAGLGALAQRYQVALCGGETTQNPAGLLLSVALIGTVGKAQCVRRAGAEVGDAIFVTGELGGSRAGRHLEFEPRLVEARWLVERFKPHAMIDLSDGLAGDLPHLLRASGVGAELLSDAIPISRAAREQARRPAEAGPPPKPPRVAALTDGEDFELLLTVPPRSATPLLDAWKREFPAVRLSCIGKITTGTALSLRDRAGCHALALHGYTHFA